MTFPFVVKNIGEKRDYLYVLEYIWVGFFLALLAIFAVSWSKSLEAFPPFKVKIFFLLGLTGS